MSRPEERDTRTGKLELRVWRTRTQRHDLPALQAPAAADPLS